MYILVQYIFVHIVRVYRQQRIISTANTNLNTVMRTLIRSIHFANSYADPRTNLKSSRTIIKDSDPDIRADQIS